MPGSPRVSTTATAATPPSAQEMRRTVQKPRDEVGGIIGVGEAKGHRRKEKAKGQRRKEKAKGSSPPLAFALSPLASAGLRARRLSSGRSGGGSSRPAGRR